MLEKFLQPLDTLSRIEDSVTLGTNTQAEAIWSMDIRPVECPPLPWYPWEVLFDAASLHMQKIAINHGIKLPDVRFRLFTNVDTDGVHGRHFGTLNGARKKAGDVLVNYFNNVAKASDSHLIE